MPDVVTIREAVQRAKAEGIPISEYSLRQLVITGAVPVRKVGKKSLLYFPNLARYLRCEDGADNVPATVAAAPGIRRVDM